MFRRSLFDELGGLDEENLPIQFNDVDLCLRMREKGYSIVYTPYAELYHHESISRGHWRGDFRENLYLRERWGRELDDDPYYNPNFSRGNADFNLRADLIRPKVLRQEIEQPKADFVSFLKSLLRLKRISQYKAARGSPRTTIVPKLTEGIVRTFRERQDKSLRLASYGEAMPGSQNHVRAEQLIWMFGSPRTGSTWLSYIMAELKSQERWHEPYVGLLFGSFVYEKLKNNEELLNSPAFIMGEPYREVWLRSIRNFVLEGAGARYPKLKEDQYLVIKEPNGSVGAPLLLEATPESRLIFLIRDGRDVVASRLDAFKRGSWTKQNRDYSTSEKLNAHTRRLAKDYLKAVSQVQEAYEAHPGRKAIVRYEDLRLDTVGALRTMYDALGVEADEVRLRRAVAKHSWDRIPDAQKGSGKFYRKAKPGGWKEDLSSQQVRIIENVTGPILSKFY